MSKLEPKQKWLEEKIIVDIYGRESNLSDVPMTIMSRKEAFAKRGYSKKIITGLWREKTQYNPNGNVLEDI